MHWQYATLSLPEVLYCFITTNHLYNLLLNVKSLVPIYDLFKNDIYGSNLLSLNKQIIKKKFHFQLSLLQGLYSHYVWLW